MRIDIHSGGNINTTYKKPPMAVFGNSLTKVDESGDPNMINDTNSTNFFMRRQNSAMVQMTPLIMKTRRSRQANDFNNNLNSQLSLQ